MQKLSISLKNCYGIHSLTEEFDFKARKSYAIYAPNGMMKTSFANTFARLSDREDPEEKRHGRTPEWSIQVDGQEIDPDTIYVLPAELDLKCRYNKALTNILVHPEQKAKYDQLVIKLEKAKTKLRSDLLKSSGVSRNDLEQILLSDLENKNFPSCIRQITEYKPMEELVGYKYEDLFNEKALEVLDNTGFIKGAQKFSERYQALIEQSGGLYQRGSFNPSKADKAFSALEKNDYFRAGHRIQLRQDENPIGLEELVLRREKSDAIINQDEELKTLHKNLTNHQKKAAFIQLIESLPHTQLEVLLERLKPENRAQFKKDLWTSYVQQSEYTAAFLEEHARCQAEIERIEKDAKEDLPIWKKAEERFNTRFVGMPYKIKIQNPSAAALERATPTLEFSFCDGENTSIQTHTEVAENRILSGGEQRIFYLLNFIFEVESRIRDQRETLFIIDDPADSFDYKNKHAILQYLADLNDVPQFHQIILTHNYDFFRALVTNGKGVVSNKGLFTANRAIDGTVFLETAQDGIRNYFNGMWKNKVGTSPAILCATIPFTRNLIEYAKSEEDPDYKTLTSLLHWRKNTEQITVRQYLDIYNRFFLDVNASHQNPEKPVIELLFEQASTIRNSHKNRGLALEEKMVLSIAIRIQAERFLTDEFRRLEQPDYWMSKTTLGTEVRKYLQIERDSKHRELLERVSMVVNSNIHLNAFMYEPIIDLGIETLIDLYDQVMKLNSPNGD